MAALDADSGLYISWTPVGSTVFKIARRKLFENRLVEYLNNFASAASQKVPFKQSRNCQEVLAQSLTNEVKVLAKEVKMV